MDITFTLFIINTFLETGNTYYLNLLDSPREMNELLVDAVLMMESELAQFEIALDPPKESIDAILAYSASYN